MAKLTAAEKKWVNELQEVLSRCPSKRLGFATIGDQEVSIFDINGNDKIDRMLQEGKATDFLPAADMLGYLFDETLVFPSNVESTVG